jgi:hypothetical protein
MEKNQAHTVSTQIWVRCLWLAGLLRLTVNLRISDKAASRKLQQSDTRHLKVQVQARYFNMREF